MRITNVAMNYLFGELFQWTDIIFHMYFLIIL